MGKKSKTPAVKAKNKKIDPSELPKEKPPPVEEEVRRHRHDTFGFEVISLIR